MTDSQIMAAPRDKVKLTPPEHPRTEHPKFIDWNGREFYIKMEDSGIYLIKSPEVGNLPTELCGLFTSKTLAEDAIVYYFMNNDKTGKSVIVRN